MWGRGRGDVERGDGVVRVVACESLCLCVNMALYTKMVVLVMFSGPFVFCFFLLSGRPTFVLFLE